MSHVHRLAEIPCPECEGEGGMYLSWDVTSPPGQVIPCPICRGTGALVAGLRRERDWAKYYRQHAQNDTPKSCIDRGSCETCQGRGWTLIPEAEQSYHLIDFIHSKGWGVVLTPNWVTVGNGTPVSLENGFNEALAQAILQGAGG